MARSLVWVLGFGCGVSGTTSTMAKMAPRGIYDGIGYIRLPSKEARPRSGYHTSRIPPLPSKLVSEGDIDMSINTFIYCTIPKVPYCTCT